MLDHGSSESARVERHVKVAELCDGSQALVEDDGAGGEETEDSGEARRVGKLLELGVFVVGIETELEKSFRHSKHSRLVARVQTQVPR